MSNHGIRHNPRIIIAVILSMIFPEFVGKKILEESGVEISDRTIRRIKSDVKEMGLDHFLEDMKKVYLIANIGSILDAEDTKKELRKILSNEKSTNTDKIKAAGVLHSYIYDTKCLYDPVLAEEISNATKKIKNENWQKDTKIDTTSKNEKITEDKKETSTNPDTGQNVNTVDANTNPNSDQVQNENANEKQGKSNSD